MPADGSTHPHEGVIITPELRPYFEREAAKERVWLSEVKRFSGVRWSAMGDDGRKPRTNRDLIRDAQFAMQRDQDGRQAYLTSYKGKARKSIADGCRKAEQVHARLNDVGAALSRGDGSANRKAEDVAEALRDLMILVADMEAFVRLAEAA